MDPSTTVFIGPDEAALQIFETLNFENKATDEQMSSLLDRVNFLSSMEDEVLSIASLSRYVAQGQGVHTANSIAPGIVLHKDRSNKVLVYSAKANAYSKVNHLDVLKHAFSHAEPEDDGGAVAAIIIPHEDELIRQYNAHLEEGAMHFPRHANRSHWSFASLPSWAMVYTPDAEEFWAEYYRPKKKNRVHGLDRLVQNFLSRVRKAAYRDGYRVEFVGVFGPHYEGPFEMYDEVDHFQGYGMLHSALVTNMGFNPSWYTYVMPDTPSDLNGDGSFKFIDVTKDANDTETRTWDFDRGFGELQIRFLHCLPIAKDSKNNRKIKEALFPRLPAVEEEDMTMIDSY